MSRGGSRYGAGRNSCHEKTTNKLSLDVRKLQRDGHLSSSQRMTWHWRSGTSIGIATELDSVRLTYSYQESHDQWRQVDQWIAIECTQCHYGGSRPWFTCPRCLRRAAFLSLCEAPVCRLCSQLVYCSQAEDDLANSWRRIQKIAEQLGQSDGDPWALPGRPKEMRLATYFGLKLDWLRVALKRARLIKELSTKN